MPEGFDIGNPGEYTRYVLENTRKVITEFGPRGPGSEGEAQALDYSKEELEKYSDIVEMEHFDVHPKAFMGWMPIAGIGAVLAMGLYFVLPWLSLALSALVLLIAVLEFVLYRQFLDPLFPRRRSANLIGIKKPAGETRRRIILGGHADAAYEWRYSRKNPKMLQAVAGGATLAFLLNLGTDIANTAGNSGWEQGYHNIWGLLGLVRLAGLPASIAIIFFSDFSRVVPGANDNLTGTFAALGIAKYFKDAGLQLENTEIRYLITGSEEAGLRGAKDYVRRHVAELQEPETVFIAFETFRDFDFLAVVKKDLNGTLTHHPGACQLVRNAAEQCGIRLKEQGFFLGATDAAAFTQAGLKAVCFGGLDPAPPRYYHTRYDDHDNMDPRCIHAALQIILEAVTTYDREGLPVNVGK